MRLQIVQASSAALLAIASFCLPSHSTARAQTATRAGNPTPYSIDVVDDGTRTVVARSSHPALRVPSGHVLLVEGWAADATAHGRAGGVDITVDHTLAVPATYGTERSDVARTLGRPYLYTGFFAEVPTGSLKPGKHSLGITVITRHGAMLHQTRTIPFTLEPRKDLVGLKERRSAVPASVDYIDAGRMKRLTSGANSIALGRGEKFTIGGWAIDPRSGGLVGAVVFLLDGKQMLEANYGTLRPDVSRLYHNAVYLHSGFVLGSSTAGWKPGKHTLTVEFVTWAMASYYMPPFKLTVVVR